MTVLPRRRVLAVTAAGVVLATGLAGCRGATASPTLPVAARAGAIEIVAPYAPVPRRQGRAFVYLTVVDTSAVADSLVGVHSRDARSALVVAVRNSGGYRTGASVASVAVPAHATVRLAPGGLTIVLTRLLRRLRAGGHLPLVLDFAGAGPVTVEVPVIAGTAAG